MRPPSLIGTRGITASKSIGALYHVKVISLKKCLFSFSLYRARYWRTVKEMIATFTVNIIVTGLMMVPLWFTGIIETRL